MADTRQGATSGGPADPPRGATSSGADDAIEVARNAARVVPPTLRGLDLEEHLRDPARKQQFVTPMFDIIAPRYDDFTRIFSFGMDRAWKAELLDALRGRWRDDMVAIDIACGTGDLALAVAALASRGRVVGVDASPRMIELANARAAATAVGLPLTFEVGDMAGLRVADGSVDLVTGGYALRNAPDWRAAVTECARVLKPGGLLVTLDFYRPVNALWRTAFLAYLRAAGELIGWWWHGHGIVYGYIAPSIAHFCTIPEYEHTLTDAGLVVAHRAVKLGGGVALHVARRASA